MLLQVTAKIAKKEAKTLRFVLSSAFGGAYSMVIFLSLNPVFSVLLKAVAAAVIILIAFKITRLKSFFTLLLLFLFTNFIFLGIIIGLYMIFKSKLIAVNNETVYFDIGARGLLLTSLFAYIVSTAVIRIYNRQLSKGELYMLEVFYKGKSVNVFALSDSGNKLREPFSYNSVIVVKASKVNELFVGAPFRLIPATTVNSTSYLKAYKPDKVLIKNAKGEEEIENVYIAASDELNNEKYSAVINPEVLSV